MEMGLLKWLMVWSCLILTYGCPISERTCGPIKPGPLQFTDGYLSGIQYARVGRSQTIDCCVEGADSVTWYRKGQREWTIYPWSNRIELCWGNQSMRINGIRGTIDETEYKCQATNVSGSTIETTFRLIVQKCDNLPGPKFTEKPKDQHVKIGQHLSVNCSGYYGCNAGAENRDVAWWLVEPDELTRVTELPGYNVSEKTDDRQEIITSTLSIASIKETDIGRKLKCVLGTSYIKIPETTITIYKMAEHETYISLAAAVGAVLILVLVVILIYALHGPYIRLVCAKWMGKLYIPTKGQYKYDLAVISAEEDRTFVREDLCPTLEENGYKVFIPDRDSDSGPMLSGIGTGVENSSSVAIVYSKSFIKHDMHSLTFNMVTMHKPHSCIIICFKKEKGERKMEIKKYQRDFQKMVTKVLYRVNWPGDTVKNSRINRNFWYSFCRRLPDVHAGKKIPIIKINTRDSVREPLISGSVMGGQETSSLVSEISDGSLHGTNKVLICDNIGTNISQPKKHALPSESSNDSVFIGRDIPKTTGTQISNDSGFGNSHSFSQHEVGLLA